MYSELRTHTAFSFGDGAVSPEALAKRARLLGYTHIGVTDCADLGGIAKFAVEAMAPTKDPACANAATDTHCAAASTATNPHATRCVRFAICMSLRHHCSAAKEW